MKTALATALLAALLLPPALATHEPYGWCESVVPPGIVEVTTGSEDATYYVDVRDVHLNVWLYEETNGVWTPRAPGAYRDDAAAHNLQRGGASALGTYETCVDDFLDLPDRLIW